MALQVYRNDDGMTLFLNDGSVKRLSAEDVENLERIERECNRENTQLHPLEVASLFPEGREYLVARIKEVHVKLRELSELEQRVNRKLVLHKDKATKDEILNDIKVKREYLEYDIQDCTERLGFFGKRGDKLRDFKEEIFRAKQYPINRLIKIERDGKGLCLWHNEKTPSMHYYKHKNKVYCFACNQGGDAVDVVRKLRGCTLKEAVSFLNGL